MEIKSVDSIEALNMRGANIDELLKENKKEFIKFDVNDARHRSRIITDIADQGFFWGSPLVNYLPKDYKENDEGCPRQKDVRKAVKSMRDAARSSQST